MNDVLHKYNFDCTQFLSFDVEKNISSISNLVNDFEIMGFEIIEKKDIETEKLCFFKKYLKNNVYELKFDEFIGEFDEWKKIDEIPELIKQFIKIITNINNKNVLKNMTVILTSFAEENTTDVLYVESDIKDIKNNFYKMAIFSDESPLDNLVIKITNNKL